MWRTASGDLSHTWLNLSPASNGDARCLRWQNPYEPAHLNAAQGSRQITFWIFVYRSWTQRNRDAPYQWIPPFPHRLPGISSKSSKPSKSKKPPRASVDFDGFRYFRQLWRFHSSFLDVSMLFVLYSYIQNTKAGNVTYPHIEEKMICRE